MVAAPQCHIHTRHWYRNIFDSCFFCPLRLLRTCAPIKYQPSFTNSWGLCVKTTSRHKSINSENILCTEYHYLFMKYSIMLITLKQTWIHTFALTFYGCPGQCAFPEENWQVLARSLQTNGMFYNSDKSSGIYHVPQKSTVLICHCFSCSLFI